LQKTEEKNIFNIFEAADKLPWKAGSAAFFVESIKNNL
jgi:hypothetical protein